MTAIMLTTDVPMKLTVFAPARIARMEIAMGLAYIVMKISMASAIAGAIPASMVARMLAILLAVISAMLTAAGIAGVQIAVLLPLLTMIFAMSSIGMFVAMLRVVHRRLRALDTVDGFGRLRLNRVAFDDCWTLGALHAFDPDRALGALDMDGLFRVI